MVPALQTTSDIGQPYHQYFFADKYFTPYLFILLPPGDTEDKNRAAIFCIFLIVFFYNAYRAGSANIFYFYASLSSNIIILFMAVEGITIQTFRSKQKWSGDFIFLFCIITVIYNANVVFYFSIALIGIGKGELYTKILDIYRFINAGCNLLYVWPILCIPRNRSYIKLF
jgi:hypothetical protein